MRRSGMARYGIVCWLGVVCGLTLACNGGSPATGAGDADGIQTGVAALPPTILLVSLDTTRADHLSAYGYQHPTTPFIEELAAEGLQVETAISPMPTTDPAHLTIFTGLQPQSHGALRNGIPLRDEELPNLAVWLRSLGYRTAAFVSRRHLIPSSLHLRGFDTESGPDAPRRDGGETTQEAIRWIDLQGDAPLFVWVHLFDAHFPYDPPEPFRTRFVGRNAAWPVLTEHWFPDTLPAELSAVLKQRYDGEIAFMDSLVEKLVRHVQRRPVPGPSPLVIVVGDHGESLDELWDRFGIAFAHGQHLSQGQLRVPLIFWWGDVIRPGMRVTSPVGLIDIVATIFDLLERPGFENEGTSSLVDGSRLVFSQLRIGLRQTPSGEGVGQRLGSEHYAVQDGRYKLVLIRAGGESRTELYDLLQDPGEERDLSSALPEERGLLLRALEEELLRRAAVEPPLEIPEEKVETLRALGYLD